MIPCYWEWEPPLPYFMFPCFESSPSVIVQDSQCRGGGVASELGDKQFVCVCLVLQRATAWLSARSHVLLKVCFGCGRMVMSGAVCDYI